MFLQLIATNLYSLIMFVNFHVCYTHEKCELLQQSFSVDCFHIFSYILCAPYIFYDLFILSSHRVILQFYEKCTTIVDFIQKLRKNVKIVNLCRKTKSNDFVPFSGNKSNKFSINKLIDFC